MFNSIMNIITQFLNKRDEIVNKTSLLTVFLLLSVYQ